MTARPPAATSSAARPRNAGEAKTVSTDIETAKRVGATGEELGRIIGGHQRRPCPVEAGADYHNAN